MAGLNLRVDRERGIIPGVKVIGFEARNRRYYPPEVLRAALSKYEGAKVNIDHPPHTDPMRPRGVADRFGVLRNVRYVDGSGVHADLHYNPKHALAEQVAWDAEHQPQVIGLSHNALVQPGPRKDGITHIAEVLHVSSVDVVADPATTRGVFESQQSQADEDDMDFSKLTVEQLKSSRPDLVRALESEHAQASDVEALKASMKAAQDEIAAYKQREAEAAKAAEISKELESAGFDPACKHADKRFHATEAFVSVLHSCETKEQRQALIADRKALLPEASHKQEGSQPNYQKPVTTPVMEMDVTEWSKRLRRQV